MIDITFDQCTCGSVVVSDAQAVADTITALRAEVERLGNAHDNLLVENEKLRDEVRVWVAHTKTAVWSDTEECKFLNDEVTRLVKSRNRWAQKYNKLLNKKRAEDGHDVYAAAREEYRKKIAEQAAEIERLRAGLGDLLRLVEHGEDEDPPPYLADQVLDRARSLLTQGENSND